MTDKTIADRQQRVIDNLHDEDFNTVKHWEGMELFNVLNDEQRAWFAAPLWLERWRKKTLRKIMKPQR
jgi:hypothetical protein